MTNQPLRKSAFISTILFFCVVGLYVSVLLFSINTNLAWSYVSLGDDIHITVTKKWGGNLVFFNHDEPYLGGIFRFAGDNTVELKSFTGYGVYYREIRHLTEKDKDWWTLMISFWYPIIMSGILPTIFAIRKLRGRKCGSTEKAL